MNFSLFFIIIAIAQAASLRSKAPQRRKMQRRVRPAALNQQLLRALRNQSYSSPYELFY